MAVAYSSVTRRFNTVDSNSNWTLANFVGNNLGSAFTFTNFSFFFLSDPEVADASSANNSTFSEAIPSNATITGIVTQYLAIKGNAGDFTRLSNGLEIPSVSTGQVNVAVINNTAGDGYQTITHGGQNNTQGLSGFTIADLDNLTWFGIGLFTMGTGNTITMIGTSTTSALFPIISPAITVHYTTPTFGRLIVSDGKLLVKSGRLTLKINE